MSVKPRSTTWALGADRYGREVTLTAEGRTWKLHRAAGNQRDEPAQLELTVEQLILIGEIVK